MLFTLESRQVQLRGTQHFVAANATIVGSVILEHESSVWFNTVIRGDNDVITVGARSNVQDGSILHTDAGIPLVLGSESAAMDAADALGPERLLVLAIRPPTVARGTSRLRITLSCDHSDAEIDRLIASLMKLRGR